MGKAKRERKLRRDAARLAADVYSCAGDEFDAHRLFASIVMFEAYLKCGQAKAAKALGWSIDYTPAKVVPLRLVQDMADQSPRPGEK